MEQNKEWWLDELNKQTWVFSDGWVDGYTEDVVNFIRKVESQTRERIAKEVIELLPEDRIITQYTDRKDLLGFVDYIKAMRHDIITFLKEKE